MLESKHWFLNPDILNQLVETSANHPLQWDEFVTVVGQFDQIITTTAPHGFLSFELLFLNQFGRQPDRRLFNTKHQIDSHEWDHPQGYTFQLSLDPEGKALDAYFTIIKLPPPSQPRLF